MSIQEHLNKIRNAIYGHEVRESIAKGIETAYDDASENGNANMEVKLARGTNPNLNARLNKMEDTDRQTTAQLTQKAQQTQVNNLEVRIEDVIQSADLDPNKDMELVDARGGEPTLGARVSKIDEIRVSATNIVENADFADGGNRWFNYDSTFSVEDEEGTLLATSKNGRVNVALLEQKESHKYYAGFFVKTTSNQVGVHTQDWTPKYHSGSGEYEWVSFITTASSTSSTWRIGVRDSRNSGWDEIKVKYGVVFDLTQAFGVGNEPTYEEITNILTMFPDNFFKGNTNLITLKSLYSTLKKDIEDRYTKSEVNDLLNDNKESLFLFGNFTSMYQSPAVDSMNTILPSMTSQELYDEYDALVSANSNRFTKNLLGYGTDEGGNEDTTLPIYEYVYTPRTHSSLENTPVILIQSGVHGDEKSPPWITLQFFKQLMSEWRTNEVIESIKNNITFKVVPLVNPGGFTDNTRNNRHGVNINRNYTYKWAEGQDAYKGVSALSEFETKISHDWMINNQNSLMLIDYHNSLSAGTYMVTESDFMKQTYSSLARRLGDLWIKGYNNYNMGGQIINSWDYGWAYQDAFYESGIDHSAVIEIGAYSKENEEQYIYDSEAIGKGVELLTNTISSVLNRYSN